MRRYRVYYLDRFVYQSDNLDDAIEHAETLQYNYSYVDVYDTVYGVKVYTWCY